MKQREMILMACVTVIIVAGFVTLLIIALIHT